MAIADERAQPSDRVSLLMAPIDRAGRGLEFGPLNRPVVARHGSDIRYIDHVGTEALREKYRDHPLVDTSSLCEVDFVLDGSPLVDLVGTGYGYVIASHVAEHVPDLIGWLTEVSEVLGPDGTLALALPDKRTTFDAARPLTLPSDLIGAHLARRTEPTPEQVAEHHMMALKRGDRIAWGQVAPRSELSHVHDLGYALDRTTEAARGEHVDVHCWVFSPQSFAANMDVLRSAGLIDLGMSGAPQCIEGEFIVHLRHASDAEHRTGGERALGDDWDTAFDDPGSQGLGERAELDAVYRSASWRLTAPLRRISQAVRAARRV